MTNEPERESVDERDLQDETPPPTTRVLLADEIFAGQREVWIIFEGARYRLRMTRRGKLILQK
jgi:hemin uptake protein HemP